MGSEMDALVLSIRDGQTVIWIKQRSL